MAAARVVEVDHVEPDVARVLVPVLEQMVVDDGAQVRILEIITIERVALRYLLLDELVDDAVRFPAARRAQHEGCPERVHHVYSAVMPFPVVMETGRKVHRILVRHQPCLLHEGLVLLVEHVIHQPASQKAAGPHACGQEADVTRGDGGDVQQRDKPDVPRGSEQQLA